MARSLPLPGRRAFPRSLSTFALAAMCSVVAMILYLWRRRSACCNPTPFQLDRLYSDDGFFFFFEGYGLCLLNCQIDCLGPTKTYMAIISNYNRPAARGPPPLTASPPHPATRLGISHDTTRLGNLTHLARSVRKRGGRRSSAKPYCCRPAGACRPRSAIRSRRGERQSLTVLREPDFSRFMRCLLKNSFGGSLFWFSEICCRFLETREICC